MKTYDISITCPTCKTVHECMSSVTDGHSGPKPNDVSLCIKCGEIIEMVSPTAWEILCVDRLEEMKKTNLKEYTFLKKAQSVIRAFNKKGEKDGIQTTC